MSETEELGTSIDELISRYASMGAIDESDLTVLRKISSRTDEIVSASSLTHETEIKPVDTLKEEDIKDIRAQISKMTVPQRVKLALFGNSIARGLLIFDPNKMIEECVLKNPRLAPPEIEGFLKSTSISEHVLRLLAGSNEHMKAYSNRVLLVRNPKTPQDVSLKWLRYINKMDLKKLAKSKNIPQVIAGTARRMVAEG